MEFKLSELTTVAQNVILRAREKFSPDHATLITFSGDLGAGKTTLIKEIAKNLGVTSDLQSPTFIIYKRYEIPAAENMPFENLIHGDMYRLESASEIEKLGWYDLLKDPKNLICIEWPEQIPGAIPEWALGVVLKHVNEETRSLDFIV